MSDNRAVSNEEALAHALNENADHIEILGSLAPSALRIKTLNAAKWGFVSMTIASSIPVILWTGGLGVPAYALSGASVVAVLGAAATVTAFWLAYYSGNLKALSALRLYKIAYKGKEILVVSKPGDHSVDYLPKVGSLAWDALNHRRSELIHKDVSGKLKSKEREELEVLERLCGAALDKAFPLTPVDYDGLIRLRDRLRSAKEANGS